MSSESKILGMLGMANRAGKVVSGEFSVEKQIKSFRAELVIVAEDASENTKKLFHNKCEFYEIPCYEFSTAEELGRILGKGLRTSVAICDPGFSNAVVKLLKTAQQ